MTTASINEHDVPVEVKETKKLEHIPMSYADGPSDWVLVRTGEDEVSVCHSYINYNRNQQYEGVYGPFDLKEVIAGLTLLSRSTVIVEVDMDDDWDDLEAKGGFLFVDAGSDENRLALRTGIDLVTIAAPCGDSYVFILSRLIASLQRARTLSVYTNE